VARRKTKTLTELELEIMRLVWSSEEVSVEDIEAAMNQSERPLTPQSIRTMLSILREKGYVKRRRVGRGYAYRQAVKAEQAEKKILADIIDRLYDGSASSLVASLVSQGMVSKDDLSEAKRLIRKREKEEEK
jgi:predicted transcriptional regulator